MSTSSRPAGRISLDTAIEDIENAILELDQDKVFGELSSVERDELDTHAIDAHAAELETALDIVADLLTEMIEPDAVEALSLDEILARYYVREVVDAESVETAGKLLECLGSKGSGAHARGLSIGQEIGYDSLKQLVEDLRKLAQHLAPDVPGQHGLRFES